jgi:murein DD-endopeptidase MepM/ murein hydrolase activator NlpD
MGKSLRRDKARKAGRTEAAAGPMKRAGGRAGRIRRAAGILLILAFPAGLAALTVEMLRTPSGVTIRMDCPSLQPGEPLLFVLEGRPDVNAAVLEFLGKTVVMRPARPGRDALAFLGLDLDVKPGRYPLDVRVEKRDGTLERIHREIAVLDKTFPSLKLWVGQEYATPPKAALERIRRESEMISLIFSLDTPEWLGDGDFIAPNPADHGPNFGQRRLTNNVLRSVHTGVDVEVPYGGPISAVNSGRVVLASSLYLSGKTIIIDHGLGVFSFYGHLSDLLVKRGDRVAKGQVIGKCGTTGRSTGPHLHWSMRIFDSRVDPYEMLALPVSGGSPSPRGK